MARTPYTITIHARDGRRLLVEQRVTAGGAFRFLRSRCRALNSVEASTGYIHRADGSLYRRFGRQLNALTGAYRETWGEVEVSGDEAPSSFVRGGLMEDSSKRVEVSSTRFRARVA